MNEKREAQRVQDRPAERGITVTNILLGFVLLLSGGFGSMFLYNFQTINETTAQMNVSIKEMNSSITNIREFNSQAKARFEYITMEIEENRHLLEKHIDSPDAHHYRP